MKGFYGGLHI